MAENGLHELIGTLSKSEKRHVMLYLRRNKPDSILLKIYSIISSGKKNIEEDLRSIPNQNVLRSYLYDQVLASLTLLHREGTVDLKLRHMMNEAEILFSRSLYSQALKKINSAEEIAVLHEKYTFELEIIELKRKIRQRTDKLDSPFGSLLAEWQREQQLVDLSRSRSAYRYQAYQVFNLSRKEAVIRNAGDLKCYEEIIESEWFRDEKLATSFQAKIDLFNSLGIYYRAKGEFDKLYMIRKRILELLELHPHQEKENPGIYISSLNNMIIACFYLKRFDDGLNYIRLLWSYKPRNTDEKLRIFVNAGNLELSYYTRTKKYEDGIHFAGKLEEQLELLGSKLSMHNRIALWFNLALINFKAGELRHSSHCISKVLIEKANVRLEVITFSRLLQLIIFLDLKDQEMVISLLRSSTRFLDKTSRLFIFEDTLLSWIGSIKDPGRIRKSHYLELQAKLTELKESGEIRETDDLIGIEEWISKKIGR